MHLCESFGIMRMPFLSAPVLCAYQYHGGNWSVTLIWVYQFLLSIRLSLRVMSLSALVGMSDLGEGSIGKLSVIVLTFNLFAQLWFRVVPVWNHPVFGGTLCSSPALNSCHLHLFVCQSKCEMITAALVRSGLKETISAAPAGSLRRQALFFSPFLRSHSLF